MKTMLLALSFLFMSCDTDIDTEQCPENTVRCNGKCVHYGDQIITRKLCEAP